MDLKLKDKTVLVTGASKGIGFSTALAFAQEGANVVLVARNEKALTEAAERIRAENAVTATIHVADLTDESACIELHQKFSEVDILVNNAGAVPGGSLHELTMAQWHSGWQLKVFGYIHLCQLFTSTMYERKSGTVLNIIGMGGRSVRANYICGAAANAALIGFTQALGSESVNHNVRVFGINPSPTATDRFVEIAKTRAASELGDESRWEEIIDGSLYPFGRLKSPAEVASLSVMLCSPQVHYLSGTVVDIDGGQRWR